MLQERLSPEELEKFNKLLSEMNELNEYAPIVVEGVRDKRALRELGIAGDIIVMNRGESLADFASFLASHYDEVVLLLDWDRKGEEINERLELLLCSLSVKTHPEIRRKLKMIVPNISTVEELVP